jgi:hypothetical protein
MENTPTRRKVSVVADSDDEFFGAVNNMADRLGLEGEDRAKYVHEHMTRGGYDAVPQYVKREPEPTEEEGGGWSPFGKRQQRQQPAGEGGGQRPPRQRGGSEESGWYT